MVATLVVRSLDAVDLSERRRPCRPPPSLWPATTVLATTRGTDARLNAATRGGRFVERLAERGARDEPLGERIGSPGFAGGRTGFPTWLNHSLTTGHRQRPQHNGSQVVGRSKVQMFVRYGPPQITVASSCCINRSKVAVACGLVPMEAEGLHRGHRREDNPVPSRGNESLEERMNSEG